MSKPIFNQEQQQTPDRTIRQQVLNIKQSFILEAPAGSGKTALIAARFLALLAEVQHPHQIMAVTFTRKAAAEMAERVFGALSRARQASPSAPANPWEALLLDLARAALERKAAWQILLRNPDALFVDTFHGFCARIARNWPLEARVAPGLPVLDEINQRAVLELAVSQYLHEFNTADARLSAVESEAFQRRLLAANSNVGYISKQLMDLLARRDRLEEFINLFSRPKAAAVLEERTNQLLALYLGQLQTYFNSQCESWQALKKHLDEQAAAKAELLADAVPAAGLKDLMAWQQAAEVFLTKAGTPRRQFKQVDFGPALSPRLTKFISELPEVIAATFQFVQKLPAAEPDNVGCAALNDMIILAGGALSRYQALLNTRGLDFMELELATMRALRQTNQPGESLIFFHEHLRHILVDEAQDMNDTQVRILGALTEGWEPGDGRSVFIVGDPKQSIFRFRRAEVSLFETLKAGLPRASEAPLPLRHLVLTANFRSRAPLVAFVNQIFSQVMDKPEKAFDEVNFISSRAARTDAAAAPAPINLNIFYYRGGAGQPAALPLRAEAREQEASYVAAAVAALSQQKPQASIAILIPARTHLARYVTALAGLGVPLRLMEGVPMRERPETRHMLNLLQALLRPYDDLAWTGALRAPWCRVPLANLLQLAQQTPKLSSWSQKIINAGRQTHRQIAHFLDAYEKIQADFGREPYASSLQRFWEELDGPAATAASAGAAGLFNTMRFLNLLRQCPAGGGAATLAYLERLLEQAYTPPDPRAAFSPITMMTIHKAKGLEFDHVFAVGLDYAPSSSKAKQDMDAAFLMDRLPNERRDYLATSPKDRANAEPLLAYQLLADLGQRRNLSEYKRLFYVACTRARETLSLSGICLQSNKPEQRASGTDSAISWLERMHAAGGWDPAMVAVLKNPTAPAAPAPDEQPAAAMRPAPFAPEPLPYLIKSPSQIDDETALTARGGTEEPEGIPRARGTIMHRIFETLARHRPAADWERALPPADALMAALAAEGIAAQHQRALALGILEEVRQAWNYPPFVETRANAALIVPEWAIEDRLDEQTLRAGRVDLMLQSAAEIILIDFKTGKSAADLDAWLAAETAKYRPQLKAYAEMAAKILAPLKRPPRPMLFFTALPHWIEIKLSN